MIQIIRYNSQIILDINVSKRLNLLFVKKKINCFDKIYFVEFDLPFYLRNFRPLKNVHLIHFLLSFLY